MNMIKIGFAAYSGDPSEDDIKDMRSLIDELYRQTEFKNIVFLLGGYWGLMRVLVDLIRERNGCIVLFPPLELEDLEYPADVIVLKLGLSMRMRSIPLVRTSDIFIAVGGESGSILEIVTSYTERKPTYVLVGKGYSTDKISEFTPYLDKRKLTEIRIFDDPRELARDIVKLINTTK